MKYARSLIHTVMQNEKLTRMCEPQNQKSMHLLAWIKASHLFQWGIERPLSVPATLPLTYSPDASKPHGCSRQA